TIHPGRARRTISAGSWFGQWSPDPPSSATADPPVPDRRGVTWRSSVSRTAGSGDPCQTKQIRNDSSRDQGAVKTNFAACQPRGQLPGLVAGAAPLVVAGAAGAAGGKRSLGMGLISILARFRSSVSKFF